MNLSKDFEGRVERAFQQRIYLVKVEWPSKDFLDCSFSILGTTKNTYYVTYEKCAFKCTCPDHLRRKCLCKHILFVLLRMLKFGRDFVNANQSSILNDNQENDVLEPVLQKLRDFLLESYDRQHFDFRLLEPNDVAAPDVISEEVKQKPYEFDECAICFEDFAKDGVVPDEDIVFCRYSCGKSLHADCFSKWADQKEDVTCVYCRAPWFEK